jgi:hypothetical protein
MGAEEAPSDNEIITRQPLRKIIVIIIRRNCLMVIDEVLRLHLTHNHHHLVLPSSPTPENIFE